MAGTADPNLPEGYSIPHDITLSHNSREKGGARDFQWEIMKEFLILLCFHVSFVFLIKVFLSSSSNFLGFALPILFPIPLSRK